MIGGLLGNWLRAKLGKAHWTRVLVDEGANARLAQADSRINNPSPAENLDVERCNARNKVSDLVHLARLAI
jgi:hypothetical protein